MATRWVEYYHSLYVKLTANYLIQWTVLLVSRDNKFFVEGTIPFEYGCMKAGKG